MRAFPSILPRRWMFTMLFPSWEMGVFFNGPALHSAFPQTAGKGGDKLKYNSSNQYPFPATRIYPQYIELKVIAVLGKCRRLVCLGILYVTAHDLEHANARVCMCGVATHIHPHTPTYTHTHTHTHTIFCLPFRTL